jgi:hypothetical protein
VTITGSSSTGRVRFAAPSAIVQIRLEIYDAAGKKTFDTEIRGGNVIDWHLQDGQAEPAPDGGYLCVLTVKSLTGRITQRIGTVTIDKMSASLQPVDVSQMSAQQSQAVGPLEEGASLVVLKEHEERVTTIIAHNGEDGLITRDRGALSFRIGDFYSGNDSEQMRLTAEGNLGIGLTHPQAKLDVDGLIRASQGIMFPDGTIQTTAAIAGSTGNAKRGQSQSGQEQRPGKQDRTSVGTAQRQNRVSPEFMVNEDLTVDGSIFFTTGSPRDIAMLNNTGGIRIYSAPTLTNSPASAAIQFFGTGSAFTGQAYIDSGAHDSAAVIFRTAVTGGTIAERMRIAATGRVGIGTAIPLESLHVVGNSNVTGTSFADKFQGDRAALNSLSQSALDAKITAGGNTNPVIAVQHSGTGKGINVSTSGGIGVDVTQANIASANPGVRVSLPALVTGKGVDSRTDGTGSGVYGRSGMAPTLDNAKVAGVSGESKDRKGVAGYSDNVDGVYGSTFQDLTFALGPDMVIAGVHGEGASLSTTPDNFGVAGSVVSGNGSGVLGIGKSLGHGVIGVPGKDEPETTAGVLGLTREGLNGANSWPPHFPLDQSVDKKMVGVLGQAYGRVGVWGESIQKIGVVGNTGGQSSFADLPSEPVGVYGRSVAATNGAGVLGEGTDANCGVKGRNLAQFTFGSLGCVSGGNAGKSGVFGSNLNANNGNGNEGALGSDFGAVFGFASAGGLAGNFMGNVQVSGSLTKGSGSFKIDHPLDPENKYLYHSFVESPDMLNIYNDIVILDAKGEAVVQLPPWFGALNRDFRYQLTPIGAPGPNLYIAEKVANNRFKIAGGRAGMEVSWQVTGIRQDAYANAHRIPIEQEKPQSERGHYLHPEAYGQPQQRGIARVYTPRR